MSETLNCPCGMSGASRLIAVHRTTCPVWIERISTKLGKPTESPLCGACGFIHATTEACPTDHVETPTKFGGVDVPSPFTPAPAPKMTPPPSTTSRDKSKMLRDKKRKR